MINLFRILGPILLVLMPFLTLAAEQPSPAAVEAILFDRDPEAEYIRIRLSGRVEPVVFQLPGEKPRVVCDLPVVAYPKTMKRVLPAGGDLIKRVRVGVHYKPEPKTRIVIDLTPEGEYAVVHEFDDADSAVSIRIALKTTEMKAEMVPTDAGGSEEEFKALDTDGTVDKAPAAGEKSAEADVEAKTEPDVPAAAPPGKTPESGAEPKPVMEASPRPETPSEKTSPEPPEYEAATRPVAETPAEPAVSETEAEPEASLQQEGALELGGGDTVGEDELPVLLDVTYETSTNDKEMVLFRLSGFHPPVVFSTEGDDLLVVCDFLDAMLGYGIEPVVQTEGRYIQKVRVDKQSDPDKVRVVLDLTEGYNYDLKQVFFKEDNLFVVVISSLGRQE